MVASCQNKKVGMSPRAPEMMRYKRRTILFVVFFGYELYRHFYIFVRDVMFFENFVEVFELLWSE